MPIFIIKIISLSLIITGIAMAIFGVNLFVKTKNFKKGAIRTIGTIMKLESKLTKNKNTVCRPVISFENEKGEVFVITSDDFQGEGYYKTGNQIEILYDKSNPTEATINTFANIWGKTIYFIVIGLFCILFGIYLFYHPTNR